MSYNGEKFEYNNLGNPTTYRNNKLVWSHGRQLDKYSKVNEDNIEIPVASYTYNANGIRTSKYANGFTTSYLLNGNKIIKQHDCCNGLTFYYGADGLTGFHIKSTNAIYNKENIDHDFYYKKNLQGDIIGIVDINGEEVVKLMEDW